MGWDAYAMSCLHFNFILEVVSSLLNFSYLVFGFAPVSEGACFCVGSDDASIKWSRRLLSSGCDGAAKVGFDNWAWDGRWEEEEEENKMKKTTTRSRRSSKGNSISTTRFPEYRQTQS